jgi:hypothetical protein
MFSITDCVASLSLNGLNLEVLQVIKIRLPKSYAFVVKLASTLEIDVFLILASSIIVSGSSSVFNSVTTSVVTSSGTSVLTIVFLTYNQ